VTAEHTGLLDPDIRYDIEQSFKAGKERWDINLLSATPTMEMGIDIGDLSSVLLCSVPPTQANYLQRIGRAGRKDGNAVTVTLANGKPHDLYFYADPLEMMAGDVQPPGIFLSAMAVMERQLIAFCFDQWVQTGIDMAAIPDNLKIILDNIVAGVSKGFPYTLIHYIKNNRSALFQAFQSMFDGFGVDGEQHLRAFLFGDQDKTNIDYRLVNRLFEMSGQRENLKKQQKEIKIQIDRLRKQPADQATANDIEAMEQERDALLRLIKSINNKPTLNFFTDEGLLPNYAFPEEGVHLTSVIFRKAQKKVQEGSEQKPYERLSFELTRPAQAALSELAPDSRFYGFQRQVQVDQVDLSLSSAEDWRLCNQCHYAENLTAGDKYEACPRCGSDYWKDVNQKQTLLKLRQVYANANDRESRIGDDADQREPIFFNRQLLVDISKASQRVAYRIDNEALPFGFEFLNRAVFREVNFGKVGDDGQEIEIAGKRVKRPGFRLCKHCGKVKKYRRNSRQHHAFNCPLGRPGAQEKDSDFYSALYLYRELESEAIRLLLPIAEVVSSDERLQSLVAALHLGLEKFFRGDVSHLQTTTYSEPLSDQADNGQRRHYLVILDRIPGGTGYLKELLRSPDNLLSMLRLSLETLKNCECNHDPDKDGCYRCLFAYRESRNLESISRNAASDLLEKILGSAHSLVQLDNLDNVDVNALIESELENRFIEVLGGCANIQLSKTLINGKPGNILSIGTDKDVMTWQIEPQVNLGKAERVDINTRPDFVFWPQRERPDIKPIAVYLDGFSYHRNKCADDSEKRMAVMRSGRFVVWSLNWKDLPLPGKPADTRNIEWLLQPGVADTEAYFNKLSVRFGQTSFRKINNDLQQGPFAWLLSYLEAHGDTAKHFHWMAFSRQFCQLDMKTVKVPEAREAIQAKIESSLPSVWFHQHIEGEVALGFCQSGRESINTLVPSLPLYAFKGGPDELKKTAALYLQIDDHSPEASNFEADWRQYWAATNLFQHLDNFCFRATSAGSTAVQDNLLQRIPSPPKTGLDLAWDEACEFTGYPDEAFELAQQGLAAPEVGVDWKDAEGETRGAMEWVWQNERIAFIDEDEGLATMLKNQGWRIVTTLEQSDLETLSGWLQDASGGEVR
jgi:DEAD/DEAH box helicase domain-containing protein